MKKYDFDSLVERRHTNCYKWDSLSSYDVIPMWVADMDFRTAPCIIDALKKRVDHGVFGYTKVPDEYYQAITGWFKRKHGWTFSPESIIYTTGVVPALSAVIKALTHPGNKVIVQTPAYNCFFSSIRNNGCQLAANELIYNEDGSYSIDFDHLEQLALDPETTLMILCNPHNPAGRIWSREELTEIFDICNRNGVTIVSDEIHCELTYNGNDYVPFASLNDEVAAKCVVCCSPSKAFNTAGLHIANIICKDNLLRSKIDRAINDNEVCDVNPFGVVGLIAAYNEGEEWLDELRAYIWNNYEYARNIFITKLPEFKITPLQGTYLMWVNISTTGMKSERLCAELEAVEKVRLSPGAIYGQGGDNFVRINLAAPHSLVAEGIERIVTFLKKWAK